MKTRFSSVIAIFSIFFLSAAAVCQAELYSFPKIESAAEGSGSADRKVDSSIFVELLAEKTNQPQPLLAALEKRGATRTEMTRLALLAQTAKVSLEKVLQEREHLVRLTKLCAAFNVDLQTLKQNAKILTKELNTKAKKMEAERDPKRRRTAGIGEDAN